MSYEGYNQNFCIHGHLFETDAHDDGDKKCLANGSDGLICGAAIAFINPVDDTNCETYGEILLKDLKVMKETETHTCPHCHHTRVGEGARYEIPKNADDLRTYRPQYGGTPAHYIKSGKIAEEPK